MYYLERLAKDDMGMPLSQQSNAFAEHGTLIHNLLDEWAKGTIPAEELPREYERRYSDAVVSAFPRMLASKGYTSKAYELGLEYFRSFKGFPDYEILGAEQRFEYDLFGRNFVGVVDMILKHKKTGEITILDHKSKSFSSFKKAERHMWRQQLLYEPFVHKEYGPVSKLAFNLFKENGMLIEKPFSETDQLEAMSWAKEQIDRIDFYDMLDWLKCKEKPDFFCKEICSVRMHCPTSKK